MQKKLYQQNKMKKKKKERQVFLRLIKLFFFKWIFSSSVLISETVFKIYFLTYFLPSKRIKFSNFILKQILSENIKHHYLKRLEFCLLNIKLKLKT